MRVFVTGAAGFIGLRLVRRLVEQGAGVTALASAEGVPRRVPRAPDLAWICGDLLRIRRLASLVEGHDALIHLAGRYPLVGSSSEPMDYLRCNTVTTAAALDACRRAGVPRFIFTSTAQVYGKAEHVPIRESAPLNGVTVYAASKIAAEALVRAYAASHGLRALTLRLFNVYGPGQPAANVVATIARQVSEPGPPAINTGRPVRDFVFVGDVVEALAAALECEHAQGQAINIGSGEGISIGELARRMLGLAGRGQAVIEREPCHQPSAFDPDRVIADISLAASTLGWRPATSLDSGLCDVLRSSAASASAQGY